MSTATLERSALGLILVDLYLRLSDFRQDDFDTFPAREAALRRRSDQLGWHVARVVVENDLVANGAKRGASAFKRRKIKLPDGRVEYRVVRPGFRSILDRLATGTVQALLAEDLDRTMRDPRDAEDLIDVIRERRAWADSLSGSLKFTAGGTDAEILTARILVSVANKSSGDTSRRVSDSRARRAAEGKNGGGRRPYGFRADGLTVDEDEAEVIRKAADDVLAKVPLAAIARDLNNREVPTVTGVRWTPEGLRDVLLKPRNAGHLVHTDPKTGETSVAATLPGDPILDENTWLAVVAWLTDPSRRSNVGRNAPRWLGTGLYQCACGQPMGIQAGGSKGRASTYTCMSRRTGRSDGQHVRRNAEALDRHVTEQVIAILSQPGVAELVVHAPAGVDVNALRAEQKTLRQRRTDLVAMFTDGDIDRAQLKAGTARIDTRLTVIEQELAAQVGRSPLTPLIEAADVAAAWQALSLGQQRAVVKELIRVTVLPTAHKRPGFDAEAIRIEAA